MSYPALGFPPPDDDGRPPKFLDRTAVDFPDDPPPPARPPRRRRAWWVVAAVAAVVILGLGALVVVSVRETGPAEDRASTATVAPVPVAPPTSARPPAPCDPAVAGAQTPAGWQPVSSNVGLTYDVPPDWTVEGCDVRLGWEKKCASGPFGFCPVQILRAGAQLESQRCPKHWRAVSGLDSPGNPRDLNRAVREKSRDVADIYTSSAGRVPEVSLTEPRGLILDGTPALQILATVTGIAADECGSPSVLHSIVAITTRRQPGAVVFVVSLHQGTPDAPDPALVEQLVATLRHT